MSTGWEKPRTVSWPTVTVKLPFAVLPAASVAVQVTVVVAIANVAPEAGEHEGVTVPSTMSLADAGVGHRRAIRSGRLCRDVGPAGTAPARWCRTR